MDTSPLSYLRLEFEQPGTLRPHVNRGSGSGLGRNRWLEIFWEPTAREGEMDAWMVVVAIVAGAGIVLALLYLSTYFWLAELAARRSGITDPDKLAIFKDSFTKTMAQIIAGMAVVATFSWTIIKDSRTLQQDAIRSANQQFVDAIKLMGSNEVDVRTGGIHATKRLVEAYPEYYWSVHGTLKSFIVARKPAPNARPGQRPPRVTADVRAATSVLGALPRPEGVLRFVDDYLVGADFISGQSLAGADLRGAKLWAADFNYANLRGAFLSGAQMSDFDSYGWADNAWTKRLAEARSGKQAWWGDERFRYIVNFNDADLRDAGIENTSATGASFRRAKLAGASFSCTDLSRADFTDAEGLKEARFEKAYYGGGAEQPIGLPADVLSKLQGPC